MSIGKYRLRRILAWVMAALMCLSAAPVTTVAAEETETTYTWTKVTSAPDTWAGEYLLVYEADSTTAYVFNGEDAVNDYVEAAISENTIIADKSNAVTLEAVDGGYVLKNASGDYLYQSSDKNGLTATANQSTAANYPLTVTVADDGVDLALSSAPHMRFNASSDQMWFRYYKSSTYTSQQAATLYALTGETTSGGETTEPAETVEMPSLTYSQTDMTVTFKCATSGVTYYYSYDETGEYTALDGSTLDVSGHIGETLYAYAELNGSVSGTNSVELTAASTGDEEQGGETEATVSTIAEVKAAADTAVTYTVEGTVTYVSGKSVYVQDETGGICLYFSTAPSDITLGSDVRAAGTYTTYKGLAELTGATDYTVIGSTSELPSQTVTIAELDSDYSGSKALQSTRVYLTNLTVGTVGTSTTLTDSDGNSIVAYGASAVLTEAGAAEDSVISLYAVVSDYNGYQLYVAQASDITVTSTGESGGEEEEIGLVSGTYVIWAPEYNMALSSTYNGYYNAGVEVTMAEDGTLSGYDSTEVWTVTVNEDGTITIASGDQNLGMAASYSSMTLGAVNDQWTLEDAGDGLYYVKNTGRDCYIEWYASNSYWSGYAYINEGSEGMFALQFTPVEDADDGGETGETTTLADGTYVIWAPAYDMALTSTPYATYYLAGEEVTLADEVLSGYSTAAIWTVTVTTGEDGTQTVTLMQDDSYLGVVVSGSYYNLTFGASENTEWTLEDAGDGLYYLQNSGTGRYLEWYASKSDWSLYSSVSSGSEGMFALQFTAVEEADDGGEEDTSLTSGTYIIWNPAYGYALSSTTVSSSSSYYAGVAVTESESGKISGYGDTELWIVTVTTAEDGTQTLTLEQNGSYMGMNASNYLTFGTADTLNHYTWTIEDAGDGLYYLKDTTSGKYVEWYSSYSDWSTYYSIASGSESLFALKFSPVSEEDYTIDTSLVEDIAQWGGGGPYADGTTVVSGDKYTVNDMLDEAATFTAVVSGSAVQAFTTGTSSGSTDISNWYMGGTGLGSGTDDYLQFAVSTAGWGDMELSFRMRASNTGSGEWQLQYSTDGVNFTNFTTGSYSCSYTAYSSDGTSSAVSLSGSITDGVAKTSIKSATYITFSFDVPEGAENAETLYIRLVPSTTVRANGVSSTPSNQGTVRIDSAVLSGSPIVDDGITGYVTVTPDNTEDQAVGTELTLSSATEGAAIYYRFADTSTGEGEWQLYSADNKPVLSSLPATLETYAVSEGRSDSITRILTYAAGTVSSVKFSPNGGGVYTGDGSVEVTLTTATEGATIYYAVSTDTDEDGNYVYETDSEGNVVYTEYALNGDGSSPISLDSGFGAVGIMAYAELEGYTTSAVTTRSFTERSQEEYNIYFGQLHSHTNYSDGAGSITDAYEHATEVHETTDTLDFLAVTDHSNSFDNASSDSVTINDGFSSEEWSEGTAYAEQYTTDEFVAIFGYEMTWPNGLGHINTYNTDGFQSRTQSDYTTYSTALQNYYATLKTATDSISQFNHPGTTFGDFSDFSYYDEEIDELIALIEVGNGEGAIGSSSYFPSYEYYTRALDKGWHVAPTNNQDNHKGLWGDANTARTVVLADSLTEESIYDAMRNYRVYATEDNDLSIYYTLDGNIMGTILSESDVDDTVTLSVKISDPTDSSLGTVSVIVNGGYVLASQTVAGNEDTVIFTVSSDYSYYYIKVVEADGDIAVTAPVWVGDVEALGVSTFEADDALAVQDQALNMTLSLYNNESSDFTVESITFTVTDLDGNVTDITDDIVKTTETPTVVESMGTADYSFAYTYSGLGSTIYTATITGTLNGVTKVYTEPLTVSYVSADMVTNVVVDGSHYNDYATGYYGGNMTELVALAADLSINVTVVEDVEDYYGEDSVLDDCALLIISAPAKKSGTANAGDYTASLYEDEFIEAVQAYVQAGGSVIVCGLADYGEASSSAEYHTAAQQNKLLEAIGSTMSLNDDEAYDVDNNGGQAYRLYLETFNMESDWLTGVVDVDSVADGEDYQVYSQYSGCTVNVGSGTWLVKGFDTTYSIDSDRDGVGASDEIESGSGYSYNIVTAEGEAVFLACEDSGYGGTIFVSGGVFCSDFEVDADVDDYDLPYANTTIITNILSNVQVELPVTDIATVREAYGDGEGSGSIYKVRGYVTAGTENSDNAFFDCIYIQDETGGIDIFPYAESGLALGTYIEVTGYLAAYQGDIELKVMSYTILDAENAAENIVDPTKLNCAEASDYDANGGLLIQAVGTVKEGSVYYNSDGALAQFTVVDGTGETVVFIDGYILSGTTGENTLAASIVEGTAVSAVGVLYMHPETLATDSDTFGQEVAVLRVRDCDEILTISVLESNVITVNAGNITAVTIDGSVVEAEGNYYVSGNVIIFTDSYLSSLGEGEHTAAVIVKVNGSSYELPVTLTITAAPSDSDTDDTSTPDTTTPDTTADASADSQDTSASVEDFWTFWNDVIAQIEAAGVNGGTVTIPLTAGYNTMPNSVMQALVENSNVALVFAYEYDGTEYEITIPAGAAVDDDTAWYGPLWLYAQYGAADPVATGSTATGDSSNVVLWVVLALIAAGAVTALLVVQKRKKNGDQ